MTRIMLFNGPEQTQVISDLGKQVTAAVGESVNLRPVDRHQIKD